MKAYKMWEEYQKKGKGKGKHFSHLFFRHFPSSPFFSSTYYISIVKTAMKDTCLILQKKIQEIYM